MRPCHEKEVERWPADLPSLLLQCVPFPAQVADELRTTPRMDYDYAQVELRRDVPCQRPPDLVAGASVAEHEQGGQ